MATTHAAGPIPGIVAMVEKQVPERLRDRLLVLLYSDPYHLRTRVRFVDRLKPSWHYECWLESVDIGEGRRVACVIPELALARLAASF